MMRASRVFGTQLDRIFGTASASSSTMNNFLTSAPTVMTTLPPTMLMTRRYSTTPTHHFDTLKITTKLRDSGFTEAQAHEIVNVVQSILTETVTSTVKSTTPIHLHEKLEYQTKTDFAHLKSEILLLEKTHFEKTMQENQRTVDKLDKSTDFLKAELSKIKSGLQLDLNLEKSRVTSQLQTFEGSLERIRNRMESETSNMNSKIAEVKFDILRYCFATIASILALGMGYLRIMKN